ncbi:hypothetical protein DCAR_0310828 [Daucus carota subsp. sativus]|uniref:Hsps-like putative alpha-crystallin-like domain-containing protein n=1 Tax=Daucus carota subsp. sativus TaxID=79200 RepID=A0AAF0WL47_DAUCS|nr:hypothetical protein DCAR_0310828 [Daucus carota subsp. sativus]
MQIFKLADPFPEHCPPGEFIRQIPLPTRIPEDEHRLRYIYWCREGPEEHEVRVCLRPHPHPHPHLGGNHLILN